MKHSRGSISLAGLVTGIILLLAVQLLVLKAGKEYTRQTEYIQSWQLRTLAQSFIAQISQKDLPAGEKLWLQETLYPGNLMTEVISIVKYSNDKSIRYLEICAENKHDRQILKQVSFTLDKRYLKMAQKYGIISGQKITGTGFLPANALYTGKEEVVLPAARYFEPWSINELPAETLKMIGLCRRFYYIDDYNGLAFAAGTKISGSGLIAAEGSITIHSGCSMAEPVILISDKKIFIEDNVRLDNILLLAKNGIVIGSGCRINGIIISEGNIIFQGPVLFSRDENMVARFSSVYYII